MLTKLEKLFLKESNLIENEPATGPAYTDAVKAWGFIKAKDKLTEADVLHCHKLLCRSRKLYGKIADKDLAKEGLKPWKGCYSPWRTRVGARLNPDPKDIPRLARKWIEDVNRCVKAYGSKEGVDNMRDEAAKRFHIKFEECHVFADANGRIGRILMNWMLLKLGRPVVVIQNALKHEYYAWWAQDDLESKFLKFMIETPNPKP